MNPSSQDLEQSWRRATDADLARALLDLDGILPDAVPIIRAEAARRGIDSENIQRPVVNPSVLARWVSSVFRFLQAKRLLAAFILGAVITIIALQLAPWLGRLHPVLQVVSILGLFLIGNALASWPLRDFKRLLLCCLAFGTSAVAWSFFRMLSDFSNLQQMGSRFVVFFCIIAMIFHWIVPMAILSGVVWLRRRYQPLYPAGHCQRCGYNLTGLPLPRCPECGLGFAGS